MKKINLILIFLLSSIVYSQNGRVTAEDAQKYMEENRATIRKISLNIKQSKRVPFNEVSIILRNTLTDVIVDVSTMPSENDEKWKYSKIDTTFTISKEEFMDISKMIKKIDPLDVQQNFGVVIVDGYSCNLKFGGIFNSMSYKISVPTSKKDSPNYIPYYREACELIVQKSGLLRFNGILP